MWQEEEYIWLSSSFSCNWFFFGKCSSAINWEFLHYNYQCLRTLPFSYKYLIYRFDILLQIESDEDVLWKADVREKNEEVASRGMKFINWYIFLHMNFCWHSSSWMNFCFIWLVLYTIWIYRLWTRKEKEIAIVTHSGFLFHTLSNFGKDCHPTIKEEICKQ